MRLLQLLRPCLQQVLHLSQLLLQTGRGIGPVAAASVLLLIHR
jgi:hypothetical protein